MVHESARQFKFANSKHATVFDILHREDFTNYVVTLVSRYEAIEPYVPTFWSVNFEPGCRRAVDRPICERHEVTAVIGMHVRNPYGGQVCRVNNLGKSWEYPRSTINQNPVIARRNKVSGTGIIA